LIQQSRASHPLGWPTRCVLLVATAGVIGLLGLARKLEPDPRGFGTHAQLGLRPCSFLRMTGRLCPTCGMTTAFAWVVRGRVDRGWRANPAGCLLALLCLPLAAWLCCSAIMNRPAGFSSFSRPLLFLVVGTVVVSVASWFVRLIVSPSVPVGPGARPGVISGIDG
jgi:hypothetical protein